MVVLGFLGLLSFSRQPLFSCPIAHMDFVASTFRQDYTKISEYSQAIKGREFMAFRFVHSSDIHLAKPFGRFDEDTRGRLREARFQSISRLAGVARDAGAAHVLLAGDIFDAETPPPQIIRQALREIQAASDITWVIMPGNHDSLAASDLWARMRRECPENAILALEPKPLSISEDVVILPAPPTARDPGRDLTGWFGEAASGEALRIGLAHGGVQDFGAEEGGLAVIAPNRAELADLDYLALGDWHGQMKISPRCWYSGAPEADNFKPQAKPGCLLVDIPARGATPNVRPVETGIFSWTGAEVDMRVGDDVGDVLRRALPGEGRRQALVSLSVQGRLTLSEQASLVAEISGLHDDFAFFECDHSMVEIEQEPGDLDEIDSGGALRATADDLFGQAESDTLDDEARKAARDALSRLFQFAREEQA